MVESVFEHHLQVVAPRTCNFLWAVRFVRNVNRFPQISQVLVVFPSDCACVACCDCRDKERRACSFVPRLNTFWISGIPRSSSLFTNPGFKMAGMDWKSVGLEGNALVRRSEVTTKVSDSPSTFRIVGGSWKCIGSKGRNKSSDESSPKPPISTLIS